ncbi:hypothetical protein FAZ95_29305 [Trinickia violacea]|uniref:Uncharacterized protein n=1 Tax=Trinickia violacea TaxID=2571746 RepID=A0A4P8IZY0_9BURK|nr:hypothetical protein [Trinickia violacea]QCP53173.1 hypothetical protein FAZ95_29305 [Trinickia violacea]
MSDVTSSDYRTLVKSRHYIDLPGEPPKSKLWPGVNNLIILRKQRDVVFDIKLGNGATYTVKTDKPQSEYGRFYDPKRNLNVTKVTFQDGEPCHIWLGRTFQGSLILKHGDKVLGRYPIRKMDCTQGCTEDPKDKPAPILIIMHDDKALAHDLLALQDSAVAAQPASASMITAFNRAKSQPGLSSSPFGDTPRPTAATLADTHGLTVTRDGQQEVLQMVHLFEVKPTAGVDVPECVLQFFASGDEKYEIDQRNILSRNWILGQMAGVGGYFRDALAGEEAWLRKFWQRKIYLVRSGGKFVMTFATGPEDWRILGVLLVGYRKTVSAGSQVMTIAGGAGKLGNTARAAWGAAHDSVMHGAGMALAFTMTVDAMVWFKDYREGKKDFCDLFSVLGIDIAKTGLVAGATSMLVSTGITIWAALFGTAALTILTITVGTVLFTIGVGYGVDWMFDKFDLNQKVTKFVHEAGKIVEQALSRDYGDTYAASEWAIVPALAIP